MILKMNGLIDAIFPITAGFGAIDSVHKTPHTGIDIAVPEGTPLHTIADGIVTQVDAIGARPLGKMVRVDCGETDVIYGHLSSADVHVGDHVRAGNIIAYSGNTGHSTGPHVHLQMITDGVNVDPAPFVDYVTVAAEPPKSWLDHLNGFADWFVGKETDILLKPATHVTTSVLERVVAAINVCSAEIITLGIVTCAVGIMVGPIVGSNGKWFGRLLITFWGGIIWRVLT